MKIINNYYFILLLLFLISTTIIIKSQELNSIDIYFNSNYGNDTIGNGTITNPYQTICKLSEILTQDYQTKIINYTIITINFAYGEYNSPNCNDIFFSNYNDFTIKSYNSSSSSSSSTSSNNNISNVYIGLYTENSNLKFKNSNLNLNINTTFINSSNIILEDKVKVTLLSGVLDIDSSNIIVRGESFFSFINSEDLDGIQVVDSSILVTERSTLTNLTFALYSKLSNTNLTINEESSIINGSIITSGDNVIINIDNSNFIDTLVQTSGTINIQNSILKQTVSNVIFLEFQLNIAVFKLDYGAKLEILNSEIIISPGISGYPIIYSDEECLITFDNVKIKDYVYTTPIFTLFGNANMNTNLLHFQGCISSSMVSLNSSSSINLNNTLYNDCIFDSLIELYGDSNVLISETYISCSDQNNFGTMITMPIVGGDYLEKSEISITNTYIECAGEFNFQNSIVNFINTTLMSTSFQNALINVYSSTEMYVESSVFLSGSYNPKGTLFNVDNSTLSLSKCIFTECSTTILKASTFSNIYIDTTDIISLRITGQSAFILINSTMNMAISRIKQSQITEPLIYSVGSEVVFYNSTISSFGSILLQSQFSDVLISYLNMSESFTQDCLFISMYDKISIENSVFENNHCYSSVLFKIYYGELKVVTTDFLGNSFGPIFYSFNSSLTFLNINYVNNSGSFIESISDKSLVVELFQYIGNRVPYDFLFLMDDTIYVSLIAIIIKNNYINQYYLQAVNVEYLEMLDIVFQDNVAFTVSVTLPSLPQYGSPDAFLNFINCQVLNFKGWDFQNNQISTNLTSIYNGDASQQGTITIDGFSFSNNNIKDNIKYIVQIKNVYNITFNNCQWLNNIGDGSTTSLIKSSSSNITIINSEMSNNDFKFNGNGTILNYDVLPYEQDLNYFQILNSIFTNNKGQYGGVFTFSNFTNSSFINPSSKFENNTLSFNQATHQGGVIFTDQFPFSLDIEKILLLNNFKNNTSLNGNNFSSGMHKGIFKNNFENVLNGQGTLIEYEFLDYYGNVFTSFSSNLNITITRNSTKHIEIISNTVTAGKGSFLKTFNGYINESYIIECKSPLYFSAIIFVKGCLQYQYYNDHNTCIYCPINYVYYNSGNSNSLVSSSYSNISDTTSSSSSSSDDDNSDSTPQLSPYCIKCDQDKLSCIFSSVSTLEGYYLVGQDVSNIQQCPEEMCLGNNTCRNSKYSTGLLCFECIDNNGNQVISKNGIHCCTRFKPILIIPILIIYLLFGLGLSLFKYTMFDKHSNIGSILIFLQLNSVIFFSYSGIYLLPLFRMSIDLLDGYCLSRNLNYIQKSLISFSIIISLFLIGLTDITLKIIQFIFKKKRQEAAVVNYPNFINHIIECKNDEIYKIKSIWSLFKIFIIPLVFNSISLMSYKNINNQNYLSLDFSITMNHGNSFSILLLLLSILILLIILIILILLLIITTKKESVGSVGGLLDKNQSIFKQILNKFYKLPKLLNYKNQFKWWDSIIIIKSILYIILSITMLFNYNQYYLASIMSIQILYSTLYILISPVKIFTSRDLNNLINLLELLIVVFSDSNLFRSIDLYYRGLSITIIIFTLSLFLILFDYIYLSNKFNNNNNNNKYKKLPTSPIINNKTIN